MGKGHSQMTSRNSNRDVIFGTLGPEPGSKYCTAAGYTGSAGKNAKERSMRMIQHFLLCCLHFYRFIWKATGSTAASFL